MKILLVDARADIQQTWVNPLRNKGWGVVLARGAEDAKRMMLLHGDGVEAFIVHEKFVAFAEAQEKPFVVLTENWKERDILAHQNSKKSAVGYLPRSSSAEMVIAFLADGRTRLAIPELKATGTEGRGGGTRTGLRLRDASRILSNPSISRNGMSSISLTAPKITLRDRAPKKEAAPENSDATRLAVVPSSPEPSPPESSLPEPEILKTASIPEAPEELEILSMPESGEPSEEISLSIEPDDSRTRVSTAPPRKEPSFLEDVSEEPDFSDVSITGISQRPGAFAESIAEPRIAPAFPGVEMTPDLEAMRAYLTMREQDVAVLTGQVRSSKERIAQLEELLKVEKVRNAEIQQMLSKAEQKIKNYDLEKRVEMEVLQKQADDLSHQLQEKTEKARVIETRLRLMSDEVHQMKERIRVDIRRIRVREKELEGQLEILKKDSGALLQARDEKILELKRRNDLLEFNMELVQEQYDKERRQTEELKGKLKEAAQVMKQANGFLEQ